MNYYPFHVGDFAAHTSHLTWEEDIAYRRMLDVYYLHERALPPDAAKVARLIRMPKSLQAVDAVLTEFFTLSDDGWHNKRADAELTSMLSKQEQQSTKDAHEADRMRRHRERRAELFAALREVNVVPPWDVPMKELQRLHDANCNGPATRTETDLQREQVQNGNATATAIPIPTPTPTPIEKPKAARERAAPLPPPDGVAAEVWTDWLALRKAKRAPVNATVIREAQAESVKAGMSFDAFLRVWCARGSQGMQADWLRTNERGAVVQPISRFIKGTSLDPEFEGYERHAATPELR